jgi:hypothetical protein
MRSPVVRRESAWRRDPQNSGLIETKVDPLLKSLHNDLRFAALLKKLNLPA